MASDANITRDLLVAETGEGPAPGAGAGAGRQSCQVGDPARALREASATQLAAALRRHGGNADSGTSSSVAALNRAGGGGVLGRQLQHQHQHQRRAGAPGKTGMKRALAELLKDHHGREYEDEMREAAQRGLNESAAEAGDAAQRLNVAFSLSRLPTMLQRSRGEDIDHSDCDTGAAAAASSNPALVSWRYVARAGRWTRSLRGHGPATQRPAVVRGEVQKGAGHQEGVATSPGAFTFTPDEYAAANLDVECQWTGSIVPTGQMPVLFSYSDTALIHELMDSFGGNAFAAYDRFQCRASLQWPPSTAIASAAEVEVKTGECDSGAMVVAAGMGASFEAVQYRYHNSMRAILQLRRHKICDAVSQAKDGGLMNDETEYKPVAAFLCHLIERHPAFAPLQPPMPNNAFLAFQQQQASNLGVGDDAKVVSTPEEVATSAGTYFFDKRDTILAAAFRSGLCEALEKAYRADVGAVLRHKKLRDCDEQLEQLAQKAVKCDAVAVAAVEEAAALPDRVARTLELHNESLGLRVYSRLEDVVVPSLPPKKHLMPTREAVSAVEKHLEENLLSDSDDATVLVREIVGHVAQNLTLHRALLRRRNVADELAELLRRVEDIPVAPSRSAGVE